MCGGPCLITNKRGHNAQGANWPLLGPSIRVKALRGDMSKIECYMKTLARPYKVRIDELTLYGRARITFFIIIQHNIRYSNAHLAPLSAAHIRVMYSNRMQETGNRRSPFNNK